jgi:hypothetical protein
MMGENMKNKIVILGTLFIGNFLTGQNLDKFFDFQVNDVTNDVIEERGILEKKVSDLEKENKRKDKEIENKSYPNREMPPLVYFKQPKIYTIYTREELRSWDDTDVLFNAGWKTVIVGKHRLILNNEMKIK